MAAAVDQTHVLWYNYPNRQPADLILQYAERRTCGTPESCTAERRKMSAARLRRQAGQNPGSSGRGMKEPDVHTRWRRIFSLRQIYYRHFRHRQHDSPTIGHHRLPKPQRAGRRAGSRFARDPALLCRNLGSRLCDANFASYTTASANSARWHGAAWLERANGR
jgi:hypothetical protein